MHVASRLAQGLSQADAQFPKTLQANATAKANNGGFAGAAFVGDMSKSGPNSLFWVRHDPLGDLPFGGAEVGEASVDIGKHVVNLQKLSRKAHGGTGTGRNI